MPRETRAGNSRRTPEEATGRIESWPASERASDLELIRWSLSLSPEDRLAVLQDFVDAFWTPLHG